jgi:hypothetical protein
LRNLIRNAPVLVVSVVAVGALGALLASSASAAIVAAKPSSSSIQLTTTGVTLKRAGAEAKSCNFKATPFGEFEGNAALLENDVGGVTWLKCSEGNYLKMQWLVNVLYDTVANSYSMKILDQSFVETQPTPWGGWLKQVSEGKAKGTWTNGSGTTHSKVTFSEALIGYVSGKPVTMTGTFTAKTAGGTLLTLSH